LAKDCVTLAALATRAILLPPSAAEAEAMPVASASEGIHIILVLDDRGKAPMALARWPIIGIDTPPRRWLSPVHGCTAAKAAWTTILPVSLQVKTKGNGDLPAGNGNGGRSVTCVLIPRTEGVATVCPPTKVKRRKGSAQRDAKR
jgi:hypothetical protein